MASLIVPIKFTHDYVKKGRRAVEKVWDEAEIALDVREVSRAEASLIAELAITKEYGGGEVNARFGFTRDGARRDVIWFENECWIEQGDYEEFREMILSGADGKGTPFHYLGHNPAVTFKAFDEIAFQREVGELKERRSTQGEIERKVRDKVAELISVDGILYCRIDEPYLSAARYLGEMLAGSAIEYDLVGLSLDRRSDGVINKVPLNEQRRRLDRIGELSQNVSVKIVDASRLYEVPERTAALTAANQILGTLLAAADDLSIPMLDVAYALRDAITAYPRHLAPAVIEALEAVRDLEDPDPEWLVRASRLYQSRRFDAHASKPGSLHEQLSSILKVIRPKAAAAASMARTIDPLESDDSQLGKAAFVYSKDQLCQLVEVTSRDERRKIARLMQCDPDEIEAAAQGARIVVAEQVQNHWGPDMAGNPILAARIFDGSVEIIYKADMPFVAIKQAEDLAQAYLELVDAPTLTSAGPRP